MNFPINPLLMATQAPPIPEVQSWAANRTADSLPLIDLLQAVPGYPPGPGLAEHLAQITAEFRLSLYTPISGTTGLREALAFDIGSTYGAGIHPDQVCITAGCNQAFYAAIIALAKPGDNVILPTPYYFNHKMTLDMLGLEARHMPARRDHAFIPDPEEAAALVDDKTRAVILVSPNNPTGAVVPPEVITRFMSVAAGRGIAFLLDETYRDFLPLHQLRAHDLFSLPDWHRTLIHLYSFSKAYSLAGYRVGAMVASPRFLSQAQKIMDCLIICAPHISQIAAQFGLENLGEWRREKRVLMAGRIESFRQSMASLAPDWKIGSIGAYFAYLLHPFEGLDSIQAARRLARDSGLLCLPGSAFGMGQERCLRAAFANIDAAQMPEIARRFGLARCKRGQEPDVEIR
jgi:aspartate/methionine/tyrosine aminotransferase